MSGSPLFPEDGGLRLKTCREPKHVMIFVACMVWRQYITSFQVLLKHYTIAPTLCGSSDSLDIGSGEETQGPANWQLRRVGKTSSKEHSSLPEHTAWLSFRVMTFYMQFYVLYGNSGSSHCGKPLFPPSSSYAPSTGKTDAPGIIQNVYNNAAFRWGFRCVTLLRLDLEPGHVCDSMECVTLPVELIEIILSLAWMLPLETEERVQFMLASTLVSTTWREVYQRVSSAHIHLPRTSYIPHLQNMLLASVPETRTFACHSISLVLDFAKPASQASPADSYSSFLTHLKSHELPKLQDISIEFANANLNNIVQTLSSAPLPETVTNLQLKWASSPSPLTTTTSSTCGPPRGKLFLPTISTARITGGSADLVVMVVSACWNLLGLQISSNDGKNSGESEIGSSKGAERRKGMTKNLCETGTQMTVFKDGFIGYATVPIWVGQLVSERNGVKEYRRTFRRMLHA